MKPFKNLNLAIKQAISISKRNDEVMMVMEDDTYEEYFIVPYEKAISQELATYEIVFSTE